MPTGCCICSSNRGLFQFPQEPKKRQKWAEICKIGVDAKKIICICIRHFDKEDVLVRQQLDGTKKPRHYLKKTAVPKLNLNINPTANDSSASKKSNKVCFLCGDSHPTRSYFKFPTDPNRRRRWLQYCIGTSEEAEIDGVKYLCEIHFLEEDIKRNPFNGRNIRLKSTAIPKVPISDHSDASLRLVERESLTWIVKVPAKKTIPETNYEINNVIIDDFDFPETEITVCQPDVSLIEDVMEPTNDSVLSPSVPARTVSVGTQTEIETNIAGNFFRGVKRKRIAYVGDITDSDLDSPETARRSFDIAKNEVFKYRRLLKIANSRLRRKDAKINLYKDIIARLRNEVLSNKDTSLF